MSITMIALAVCLGLMAASIATLATIVGRGSEVRTETHTVEFYHGCQWSTWQTPTQDRIATAAGIIGFITAFPGAAAVMLLPLLID